VRLNVKLPFWLQLSACGALAAFASGCGDLLYAEGDVPEACITEKDAGFQGFPIPGTYTVSREFKYDVGAIDVLTDEDVDAEAKLLSLTLTANSGLQDMGFIDHVKGVATGPAGSNLPPLTLIDYTKPAGGAAERSVSFAADQTDVLPYFADGKLQLAVEITGSIPQNDWSVDARGCLAVKGKVKYLKAMQE
jgi:hypothetical protein